MDNKIKNFTYEAYILHDEEAIRVKDKDGRTVCGLLPAHKHIFFDFPGTLVDFSATVRAYKPEEIIEILNTANVIFETYEEFYGRKKNILRDIGKKLNQNKDE